LKTILYFSPTGNARYIAAELGESIGTESTELLALEFTDPANLVKREELIIVYSIHAFNPPRTVRRFVRNIPAGLFDRVSIIGVGCTDSWVNRAVSSGLRKNLEKKGYPISIDEIFAMPLTFVISFPDELIQKLVSSADEKIGSMANSIPEETKSKKRISIWSRLIHLLGKAESPAARSFGLDLRADSRCTSCGICVANCPEKNIRFNSKNKPKFGLNCLMCMRCIYNCPENAIAPRINKFLPIKGGYDLGAHLNKK
jgi:ferredoxin